MCYTCLPVIVIESVASVTETYHRHAVLEDYKYEAKENKQKKFIYDDLDPDSSDDE